MTNATKTKKHKPVINSDMWNKVEGTGMLTARASCPGGYENQLVWVKLKGVLVLRNENPWGFGARFFGVPASGRKNSKLFDILEEKDNGKFEYICQLTKQEACGWLCRTAYSEYQDSL